ncbi:MULTISPECIES: hypothetical protein [unclassified Streptomyces]|uniref:hypothetical protein n=1 Tax=unclassified Streptomyces TaxID=2593676 RepID=UPI000BACD3DB|nr:MULTISPECIES: hypothetical protein [unclassified Streptomyces]ASY36999.1 hypothetical protein CAC01_30640 [Streptomyces sp. CLI2509]MYX20444.1 hypothetical protein [Streptomyces sp. SID8380]
MDLRTLTQWMRARYQLLAAARDRGATSTEIAVIAGGLLLAAGLVIAAVRTKLAEKIGIINGA